MAERPRAGPEREAGLRQGDLEPETEPRGLLHDEVGPVDVDAPASCTRSVETSSPGASAARQRAKRARASACPLAAGISAGAERACVGVRGVVAVGRVAERLRPERVGSPSREERGALDRCEHHRGGARVLGGGQAEEAVDAERPGDPVVEQRADRASVGDGGATSPTR